MENNNKDYHDIFFKINDDYKLTEDTTIFDRYSINISESLFGNIINNQITDTHEINNKLIDIHNKIIESNYYPHSITNTTDKINDIQIGGKRNLPINFSEFSDINDSSFRRSIPYNIYNDSEMSLSEDPIYDISTINEIRFEDYNSSEDSDKELVKNGITSSSLTYSSNKIYKLVSSSS